MAEGGFLLLNNTLMILLRSLGVSEPVGILPAVEETSSEFPQKRSSWSSLPPNNPTDLSQHSSVIDKKKKKKKRRIKFLNVFPELPEVVASSNTPKPGIWHV